MDRTEFLAAVAELLQVEEKVCDFDDPLFETPYLEVSVNGNTSVTVLGAEGWPLDLVIDGEGKYPDINVSGWQEAFDQIKTQATRSAQYFKQYEGYVLSAMETCKTFTKIPVRYEHGHENQRPILDVYLAEVPNVRLYRLECSNSGYISVATQYDEHRVNVDRWFIRAPKPAAGTHVVVEVHNGIIHDDETVASLIQTEATVKETNVKIHKTAPHWPDLSIPFYRDLMKTEERRFVEFIV